MILVTILLLLSSLLFLGSWRQRRSKKLPPGDDGWSWPLIGETPAFLKEPYKFLDRKRATLGGVFRTSLFGQTSVVLSTPESARFVLVQAHQSFKHGYRPSITRIIDPELCFSDPATNSRVRKLASPILGPENVHDCIPAYDRLVLSVVDGWRDGQTVNTVAEMETVTLKCILHLLWGQEDRRDEYREVLRLHTAMNNGNLAPFPLNLPFTAYGKAMKACGEFQRLLREKIDDVRRGRGSQNNNVLKTLLRTETDEGLKLSDEQVSSVLTTLIFAGYRSTATILVWVFKFLHDNPEVLSDVKAEQMGIRNGKEGSGSDGVLLTWDDVKRMPLTMKVIKETMRLVPIAKFMSRVALEDVEYNGYVIPKGWRAYVSYHFHFDPKLYPEPQTFDPTRFNAPTKPNTFIPFGSGPHLCVGYEFTNSVIPLVVHRVLTNFSFEREGEDGVRFWPHYVPKDGYPLKIRSLQQA